MGKPVVAIVGSAMMDLTAYAKVLPQPGQTLVGDLFTTGYGGKGANQAVIAAHCGANTFFIGALGRDSFGESIALNFKELAIDITFTQVSDTATGVAHIWVDGDGENRIVIIPGANSEVEIARASSAIGSIEDLSVVIAQCEIHQDVTVAAFHVAKGRGATTILNPAPFAPLSPQLLELTDWLIPNETEFKELHGSLPTSDQILKSFRPGKNSVITLGSQGAVVVEADGSVNRVSAPVVNVVDSTGAGDAFVGTFAFALANGMSPVDSARLGVSVASFSVTRKGAQSSYPTQAEIEMLS